MRLCVGVSCAPLHLCLQSGKFAHCGCKKLAAILSVRLCECVCVCACIIAASGIPFRERIRIQTFELHRHSHPSSHTSLCVCSRMRWSGNCNSCSKFVSRVTQKFQFTTSSSPRPHHARDLSLTTYPHATKSHHTDSVLECVFPHMCGRVTVEYIEKPINTNHAAAQ